jgi:hypothetical protein
MTDGLCTSLKHLLWGSCVWQCMRLFVPTYEPRHECKFLALHLHCGMQLWLMVLASLGLHLRAQRLLGCVCMRCAGVAAQCGSRSWLCTTACHLLHAITAPFDRPSS